ncbi:hypothetical protein CIW83_18330 [Tissierella sp. P1]|uniref:hypothetical protein n=1 Tax=Tissierella sp. P1 TaxID=1280483 RepID=UPI000B9FC8C0|nr:hypothetical protein [Tissierella sp. P1]OZV10777.1 hypothetical protein CIW83_18330 [Tissierella sp. P1]
MTIGEYIRQTDIEQYKRLINMFKVKIDKPKKKIELGCSIEELMRVDSYKREGRRVRQRSWDNGEILNIYRNFERS